MYFYPFNSGFTNENFISVENMEKGEVIGKGRAAEVIYWDNNRVLKLFYKDFPRNIIDYQFKVDTLIGKIFPNCPKAFEKIEENGRIGIVYEYIEGHSTGQ